VRGLIQLMATPAEVTGPVNLGNPVEFTVLELAQKVLEKTGSSARIRLMPLPQDDPTRRRPDIARASELLGWQPTVGLDAGLERTIRYFREVLQGGLPQQRYAPATATRQAAALLQTA
jgi:UDP-glucuronate decarboxylase